MIAEILETALTIMGAILILSLTIAGYYVSYDIYATYRKDPFLKEDKMALFSAIFIAFLSTIMVLVFLLGIAQFMGW